MDLEKLELALLESTTERFSHWTQRWFGIDCFDIAEKTAYLSTTSIILCVCFTAKRCGHLSALAALISCGFILHMNWVFLRKTLPIYRMLCKQDISKGMQNRFKLLSQRSRIWLAILMVPISLYDVFAPFFSTWDDRTIKFFLYGLTTLILQQQVSLICCTPLSPTESKLKKLVTSTKATLASIFNPDPLGSPAG